MLLVAHIIPPPYIVAKANKNSMILFFLFLLTMAGRSSHTHKATYLSVRQSIKAEVCVQIDLIYRIVFMHTSQLQSLYSPGSNVFSCICSPVGNLLNLLQWYTVLPLLIFLLVLHGVEKKAQNTHFFFRQTGNGDRSELACCITMTTGGSGKQQLLTLHLNVLTGEP